MNAWDRSNKKTVGSHTPQGRQCLTDDRRVAREGGEGS